MDAPVFRLYACCIPVRGALRSTVCDLQRSTYHLIPNGLYEILTLHRDHTVDEVKEVYGPESHGVIDEYFAFLESNELGFWTHEPESFPDLDRTWQTPETITNAIVDVDAESRHDWQSILSQLADLGCKALQLRFFCAFPLAEMDAVLELASYGPLRTIDLVLKWTPEHTPEDLRKLVKTHRRISAVSVHSAPENQFFHEENDAVTVLFVQQEVTSDAHCGQVRPAYFTITTPSFMEALHFNSCLNRKLAVDARGEIRNCPSLPGSFGNVAETSLHSAVMQQRFRDLWEVNKDQVEVCKDCEFRYICPDCRAFVREPGDHLSKPAKCGYDPYTAQWAPQAPVGPSASTSTL